MTAALRLLADDLTGALDAGAPFVARAGPLPVRWTVPDPPPPPDASLLLDGESRELAPDAAAGAVSRLAPILTGAGVAFKKIDSLLRGHIAVELDACLTAAPFAACVLAPAFPFQGRVTRGGRQHVRGADGTWTPLAADLAAGLAALGRRPVTLARRPDDVSRVGAGGIVLCDAETDADLAAIVAAGRRLAGPVLWCGAGGLAAALAGDAPTAAPPPPPRPPLLIVVGTDHAVTRRQVERLGAIRRPVHVAADGATDAATAARLSDCLEGSSGFALLTFRVAPATSRAAATTGIRKRLARVLPALRRPPAGLIVTGGATLLAVALAVDADHLELHGQLMPGVPVSRLRGGPWDGVTVASKSGAFGEPDLLARLTAP